ncbi:uncharacterized protein LOC119688956 [Teleopsis dalmanni]|uniref:uncharacterized protein LOC119688956 n=1 Tax=Teleopsis dalmanni TaxID=139649 RepID=UPI0018CDC65D|nr:uncharacterized protein LOC119688956 [Teleopsis dalmanni]
MNTDNDNNPTSNASNNAGNTANNAVNSSNNSAINLNNLKQQRSTVKRNMTSIRSKIEKEKDEVDPTILECRLQILESHFKQLCHIQSQIEQLNPEDNARADFEELFVVSKAKILNLLKETRSNTSFENSVMNTTSNFSVAHNSRLPFLKLPKFDGKYANYNRFIAAFKHLVHNDPTLSDVDKFNYLLSCLTGPALAVIEAFQITAENYPKAMARLKERFDNKVLIFLDHITELFNIPGMIKADPASLRKLIDTVAALRSSLLSLGSEVEVMNAIIIYIVLSKVDAETKFAHDEKQEFEKMPSWDECYKMLSRRCQFLEGRATSINASENKSRNNFNTVPRRILQTHLSVKSGCEFCKAAGHFLGKCPSFLATPVSQRFDFVKKAGCCINCLTKGHSVTKCKSESRCRICRSSHHTHLHKFTNTLINSSISCPSIAIQEQGQLQQPNSAVTSLLIQSSKRAIIPTVLVFVMDKFGLKHPVRALLDSCSELNFITEETAKILHLKWQYSTQEVFGISNLKTLFNYNVYATAHSRTSDFEWSSQFTITKSISSVNHRAYINVTKFQIPTNIQLADPLFDRPCQVDMLIGAEIFFDLLLEGKISLGKDMPYLINTVFGWVAGGTHSTDLCSKSFECNFTQKSHNEDTFLERFWELEEYKISSPQLSAEEKNCEQHYIKTVTISENGRVQVRLPFKVNPDVLGKSFHLAKQRFLSLEHRLQRDQVLYKMYSEFMNEYVSLGHMSNIKAVDFSKPHYFIPHHCVLRPQSLTTKLRVVFDASAKTCSKYSLNDTLMVGPTIQQNLITTLMAFRLHKYALTADIAKMYRQFLMDKRDRWFQLVLWRDNPHAELQIFQLNTVTYGTSSAPFLAIRSLFHIADMHIHKFPIGASTLKTDLYVDDLLTGANTITELLNKKIEITNLLSKAGLQLAKWSSNCDKVVSSSDESFNIKSSADPITKALGMVWKPKTNRTSEIQEMTKNIKWHHVPSKDNPADIVSRGSNAEELPKTIWFSGPAFLYLHTDKWPSRKIEFYVYVLIFFEFLTKNALTNN